MVGTGTALLPAAVDPFAALALAALEVQAEGLIDAAQQLSSCRTAIPVSADGTWQGPAHLAYETGLQHLTRLVSRADDALDEARTETRRAIAALEQTISGQEGG